MESLNGVTQEKLAMQSERDTGVFHYNIRTLTGLSGFP